MPTMRLGRTEHHSSRAILGGAAFWGTTTKITEAAFQMALDRGVNHLDIAPSYGHAELVVGPLVPAVRNRLFISEKSHMVDGQELRSQFETSLERLGCDSFDLYQVHGVTDLAELDRRSDAFEAILRARDEGLTRFVGITGHDLGTAAAQLEAVRRWDLDTVMLPIYVGALAIPQYAADLTELLLECAKRDVGVMAIKAVAHQPWGNNPTTNTTWYQPWTDQPHIGAAVDFTLGTPGVAALCTPGDVTLLADVLDAVCNVSAQSDMDRQHLLDDADSWPTIFPLTEHFKM